MSAKITVDYARQRFEAISSYEDREILKKAKFRWDPDVKRWYAMSMAQVRVLMEQAQVTLTYWAKEQFQNFVASQTAQGNESVVIPAPEGLEYLPYQKAGIEYAAAKEHTLIADEMGLGKTIQAIGVVNADANAQNVLVITPASLKIQWKNELARWLTRPLTVGICDGKEFPETQVAILNYEQVGKFRPKIDARDWDILICDEAHYLKNSKSQRSQAILGGKDAKTQKKIQPIKARRKVFLTGTPILNRPIEIWPFIRAFDPGGLGKDWMYFVTRYCGAIKTKFGWDTSGASNLDELQAYLRQRFMVRRLKQDVLQELPGKRRTIVVLDPKAPDEDVLAHEIAVVEQYRDARQSIEQLQEVRRTFFADISRARHITALAKAPLAAAYIRDLAQPKIVVMCWHKDVAQRIAQEFSEECVVVTGDTPLEERQQAVESFQNDPKVTVFIGTMRAAGTGLTLTAASNIVFVELDWTPGVMAQAEDRVHRIGQKDFVNVIYLVFDHSLDARIAKTLLEKQENISQALDMSIIQNIFDV